MIGVDCSSLDIGPNLTSILMLAGPTLTGLLLAYTAKLRHSVQRTETAAAQIADTTEKTQSAAAQIHEEVKTISAHTNGNSGEIPITPTDIRDKPIGR